MVNPIIKILEINLGGSNPSFHNEHSKIWSNAIFNDDTMHHFLYTVSKFSTFKDDFQSVLRSLKTLMFITIINGSLDGMRIDVIR